MKTDRLFILPIFMCAALSVKAEPLAVGAQAPAAVGTTDAGQTLNFADVYKKGFTLVYFFPKADTRGCTAEGCSLRDAFEKLTQKGVTVIGVSVDSVEAQKNFKGKYHFPFTLIADPDKTVVHAFGVPTIPVAGFAKRQSFLIDKTGKIVWRDLHASTDQQANDVLKALQSLGG